MSEVVQTGSRFKRRGQRYRCAGRFGHEIPARFIWIYELRSECAECGSPFSCTGSSSQIKRGQLRRRCDRCKAHWPVSTAKKKRAPLSVLRKTKRRLQAGSAEARRNAPVATGGAAAS